LSEFSDELPSVFAGREHGEVESERV
jgi:hypothetical protein